MKPVTHVQSLRFTGKLMLYKVVLILWSIILAQQALFIITYQYIILDTERSITRKWMVR